MHYLHRCSFCGWQRRASSAVLLPARCGDCGSALEALRAGDLHKEPAGPHRARSRAARALAVTLALALTGAAFNAGLQAGGISLAIVGSALMIFALLPFFRRG